MTLETAEEELALQEARENDAWDLYLAEVAKTRAARIVRDSLLIIASPHDMSPEERAREFGATPTQTMDADTERLRPVDADDGGPDCMNGVHVGSCRHARRP